MFRRLRGHLTAASMCVCPPTLMTDPQNDPNCRLGGAHLRLVRVELDHRGDGLHSRGHHRCLRLHLTHLLLHLLRRRRRLSLLLLLRLPAPGRERGSRNWTLDDSDQHTALTSVTPYTTWVVCSERPAHLRALCTLLVETLRHPALLLWHPFSVCGAPSPLPRATSGTPALARLHARAVLLQTLLSRAASGG
jgi:hypothetical protein